MIKKKWKHLLLFSNNGFSLYAKGTYNFYNSKNINIKPTERDDIENKIKDGFFGLVINLSIPDKLQKNIKTGGYYMRRLFMIMVLM